MATAEENRQVDPESRDGLQVLSRAASALDEIATAPGQLGLAKSTARRLLVGLVDVGFAAVDSAGRYRLGDRLLGLSSADGAHLAAAVRPVIEAVADATGETVDVSVLRGDQMWFVDQIESTHRLRAVSAIGGRFPLLGTANGKAALAALDDAELDAVLARQSPDMARTLRDQISPVRAGGLAFDRDEHTAGISAAGIAGRLPGGHVVAVSVPAPTDRFTLREEVIVEALRAAAAAAVWESAAR